MESHYPLVLSPVLHLSKFSPLISSSHSPVMVIDFHIFKSIGKLKTTDILWLLFAVYFELKEEATREEGWKKREKWRGGPVEPSIRLGSPPTKASPEY